MPYPAFENNGQVIELRRIDDPTQRALVEIDTNGIVLKSPALVTVNVTPLATAVSTGDDQAWFHCGPELAGFDLTDVRAYHATTGSGGSATTINFRRDRGGTIVDMLSTALTIDVGERNHTTAATPAVINTANDDIADGDLIRVDIDAVPTTPPNGLTVALLFAKP